MIRCWWRSLMICGISVCFLSCGSSKDSGGASASSPHFDKSAPPVLDKDTLTLKTEGLQLTHVTQTWKPNSFTQGDDADKYTKLQKKFVFPIQFNGWVTLDRVEHNYLKCAQATSKEPEFILEDDHNGAVFIRPGEKVLVSLEKLYVVRLEFANIASCKSIDIQFGVLYGTNE